MFPLPLPSIGGGELFERIVDDNFEHTEPTSARYMQQILEGMQYVHKQNIVHLDLKPENIVCVDPTGTRVKIIDFGLASKLGEFDGSLFCFVCFFGGGLGGHCLKMNSLETHVHNSVTFIFSNSCSLGTNEKLVLCVFYKRMQQNRKSQRS